MTATAIRFPGCSRTLKAPSRAIVGPWNHRGPDSGSPGPAIDWLREAARFFDRYLKGIQNGIGRSLAWPSTCAAITRRM